MAKQYIAVIMIRTLCKCGPEVRDTLGKLNLSRKQHCVVVELNPSVSGMIQCVRDIVTYGEISEDTYQLLKDKKGEKDPKNPKELKKVFRLNPPRGGYERKGIKVPFNVGGALGKRDNMDVLISKMI